MKKVWIVILSVLCGYAYSSNEQIKSNYIDHYTDQVRPLLTQKFTNMMPEKSSSDVAAEVEQYIGKMANCQYESVSHYPEAYWSKAIIPVSEGIDIYESNQAFEDMLNQELALGNITQDQILSMVYKTKEKIQQCLQQ